MWTWRRMPLYLVVVTYLLVGATTFYDRYQLFLRQHHDYPRTKIENANYCDVMMGYKDYFGSCKPLNVFIHDSEVRLQDVCGAGGQPYHGTGKRQSRNHYPVTICRLGMKSRAQQCTYYATFAIRRLVVTCNKNSLPVQLDQVLTMAR